jgi:hypothetical protein
MALANVGCILAQQQKRVLLVDWDLDAPGLHNYFLDGLVKILQKQYGEEHDATSIFNSRPGLIEFFARVEALTSAEECVESGATDLFERAGLGESILKTGITGLSLLKAGRFDDTFGARVNALGWKSLYDRCPWLFQQLANHLRTQYDFVLVDSRTGVTDISGICTALLPDKLVGVFTPNHQSLDGLIEEIRRAVDYRRRSDDLRPLVAFPLPSRVESTRPSLRNQWLAGQSQSGFVGYRSRFESLFQEIYDLPSCDLGRYFREVEVQQVPDYAFGEEIAALVEQGAGRLSMSRSYEVFTRCLTESPSPWAADSCFRPELGEPVQQGAEQDGGGFDVFFCYSKHDESAVTDIAWKLRGAGIRVLLDLWDLQPGRSRSQWLEQVAKKVPACAFFIGPFGVDSDQRTEFDERLQELIDTGPPLIPVLLPGAMDNAPFSLRGWGCVDFSKSDPDPIDQLIWGITGKREYGSLKPR